MPELDDEDKQLFREVRRQEIIDDAVMAADHIILKGSDGSLEETNFLTAKVAHRFMEKALMPYSHAILKKDIGL
jgi:hypothetical protein